MTFASRITRTPRPYNPERGAETVACLPDAPTEARELLLGTGGCSPYLRGLIEKEAPWLRNALASKPEGTLETTLSEVRNLADEELTIGLRQAKRRVALLTALADLGGVWTLEEVTTALTRFADLATDRALAAAIARATRRAPELEAGGIAVLAMGKMGAFELNYSSDIDLICLIDDSRYEPSDFPSARAGAVKAVRAMAAMLSDVTADGYVFRTDLRLRPDPAVTPVCVSMDAAERYYESLGRAWERAAYIKARAAAGDIAAGEDFLERLTPFVWRRHLDFAAIQDAQSMRLKIREHKGTTRDLDGYDVKLGPGGIREIEFYTQTRQIIPGGRDPGLRQRETVSALEALQAAGWTDAADQLTADYRAHREVEHRLQMIADRQTHALPTAPDGFERLAAFMDTDVIRLRADLSERFARVSRITEDFFTPHETRPTPELSDSSAQIVAQWPSYPALRSDRAVEVFNRIQPDLLDRLNRAARPEEALGHFDGFLRGLPAGVQLFSLFDANPQLIDLIVDICATSPALAQYLSRHSDVLDVVIGGSFFADWPGTKALTADLTRQLTGDYETQLLAARRWRNDWHFRIGVHHLRGLISATTAGRQYAAI
ncbi:MAG: glutamine-synthetase adenylyltransferase, partial [Pseudomonadota bacterium]